MFKERFINIWKTLISPFRFFSYKKRLDTFCEKYTKDVTNQIIEENKIFIKKIEKFELEIKELEIKVENLTFHRRH